MEKLLPCPFCGEKTTQAETWVGCQSGNCYVRPCAKYYRDISVAIKNWNTRSSDLIPRQYADDLASAAQDVIDRWTSPLWKDQPATAEFINRLRDILSNYRTRGV